MPAKSDALFDLFAQGCQLWDLGKDRAARRLFEQSAGAGDTGSLLNYGYFLEQGLGGARDVEQAMRCYRRAYRRGSAAAANNIAILYREASQPRRAEKWFERALSGGDVGAGLQLGRLYRDFFKDVPRARRCFRMVARSRGAIPSEKEEALALIADLPR
jgi:uncharacterized protein